MKKGILRILLLIIGLILLISAYALNKYNLLKFYKFLHFAQKL